MSFQNSPVHLRSIEIRPVPQQLAGQFPFNVPAIQSLGQLSFSAAVTFLVGENGSGKSTMLEALACAVGAIAVGAKPVSHDPSLEPLRRLAQYFKLTWVKRTRKGFYLRAEDFFGFARRVGQMQADLSADLAAVDTDYLGRSDYAKSLAKMPYQGELGALERSYGAGPDSRSHGESFLRLFQERFVPGGLYLLDEPEAPLSPVRQLALLAILRKMIRQEAQFIIATHSPILMAFPDAAILNFDGGKIHSDSFDQLDHVRLTRDFLNHPEVYLRQLEEGEGDEG